MSFVTLLNPQHSTILRRKCDLPWSHDANNTLESFILVVQLVVLSDRISEEEMDIKQPPIPTLLAVGSVHHHLIRSSLLPDCQRCAYALFSVSIIVPHNHALLTLRFAKKDHRVSMLFM